MLMNTWFTWEWQAKSARAVSTRSLGHSTAQQRVVNVKVGIMFRNNCMIKVEVAGHVGTRRQHQVPDAKHDTV